MKFIRVLCAVLGLGLLSVTAQADEIAPDALVKKVTDEQRIFI